jgi:hypothetical protein
LSSGAREPPASVALVGALVSARDDLRRAVPSGEASHRWLGARVGEQAGEVLRGLREKVA